MNLLRIGTDGRLELETIDGRQLVTALTDVPTDVTLAPSIHNPEQFTDHANVTAMCRMLTGDHEALLHLHPTVIVEFAYDGMAVSRVEFEAKNLSMTNPALVTDDGLNDLLMEAIDTVSDFESVGGCSETYVTSIHVADDKGMVHELPVPLAWRSAEEQLLALGEAVAKHMDGISDEAAQALAMHPAVARALVNQSAA